MPEGKSEIDQIIDNLQVEKIHDTAKALGVGELRPKSNMFLHEIPGGQVLEFRTPGDVRAIQARFMKDDERFILVSSASMDVKVAALLDIKENRARFDPEGHVKAGGIAIEVKMTDRDLMAWTKADGIDGRRRLANTIANKVSQAFCRILDQSAPQDVSCEMAEEGGALVFRVKGLRKVL